MWKRCRYSISQNHMVLNFSFSNVTIQLKKKKNSNSGIYLEFSVIKKIVAIYRVFWVNIAKSKVNLRYKYCSKLFGILRREIEFRYHRCRNSTKSIREKKKKVERENVEFRQQWYRISSAQFCCPKWKGKNWQTNCGNAIVKIGV